MHKFSQILIEWHKANARNLPWKTTQDPYIIWVSEIILQQTRIQQGLPYYHRFIEKFPNVSSLACASEDEVLNSWKGLGYYSRARNMHATAKQIQKNLDNKFPSTYESLIKLKGIGPYTAAAIASFAFGEVKPVMDGNVIRVLSRYFAISGNPQHAKTRKELNHKAQKLITNTDPAKFNQAIMDFGSLQCKPGIPECKKCPFSTTCKAFLRNEVQQFPSKKKQLRLKQRYFHYIVVNIDTSYVLKKRTGNDIWKGLYEFPIIEKLVPRQCSTAEIYSNLTEILDGNTKKEIENITTLQQTLSHQKIQAYFYDLTLSNIIINQSDYLLVDKKNLSNFAVPKIVDRYLKGL